MFNFSKLLPKSCGHCVVRKNNYSTKCDKLLCSTLIFYVSLIYKVELY